GPANQSGTTFLANRPTLDTSSDFTPCFARGTRILTERGEIAVEALAEGDRVVTFAGELGTVVWIGRRRIDLMRHRQPALAAPVVIRPHALADDQPRRDLIVSPDHSLYLDGRLVPAKLLINGMTIVHLRDAADIEYYHVELARHAVLLAEGAPAE